jgi:hypothetical protein
MRVRAVALSGGALPSSISQADLRPYSWIPASRPGKLTPGIHYRYSQPDSGFSLQAAASLPPLVTGTTEIFSLKEKRRPSKFCFDFEGYIRIDQPALYTFYTNSDDGSKLVIDGIEVVNNDGNHGATEVAGKIALTKGFHSIRVLYSLQVDFAPQGGEKKPIPAGLLFHKPQGL